MIKNINYVYNDLHLTIAESFNNSGKLTGIYQRWYDGVDDRKEYITECLLKPCEETETTLENLLKEGVTK